MYKIIICNNAENLKRINPTHTVEAEYGDTVVEGSKLTLAHHTGEYKKSNPPCVGGNINCISKYVVNDNSIIGISHVDWDTIGGIMTLIGNKPNDDIWGSVWGAIGFIDLNGIHKINELNLTGNRLNILNSMYAFSEKRRVFSDRGGITSDVTSQIQEFFDFIKAINIEASHSDLTKTNKTPLLDAGKEWIKSKEKLNEESFLNSIRSDIIIRSSDKFTNAMYNRPGGKVFKSVVALNVKTNAITLSFEDGGKNHDASEIMKEYFGNKAGGHSGIAGTPRDGYFTKEVLMEFANHLSSLMLVKRKKAKDLNKEESESILKDINNKKIKVKYVNIDNWNRPVFKDVNSKNYYGSLDILFPYNETESEVLKNVTADNLTYFGNKFDCEPLGSNCNVEIVS